MLTKDKQPFKESVYSNKTNKFMYSVDNILDKQIYNQSFNIEGVSVLKTEKFKMYVINPFIANVSGLVIFNNNCESYRTLYKNSSKTNLKNMEDQEIEFAFYIPEEIFDLFWSSENFRIVLKIYDNDNLFQEKTVNQTVEDKVYSISIPGFKTNFNNNTISLLFNSNFQNIRCNFWNYSTVGWDSRGISVSTRSNNALFYFETNHLTSFTKVTALYEIRPYGEFWLNFITTFGSIISVICIMIVIRIAINSRKWRNENLGSINLSIAILIQIIILTLSNFENIHGNTCKWFGYIIQYAVLVQFSLVFIYILLKYIRERKLRHPEFTFSILVRVMSILLSWTLPMLFVFAAIIFEKDKCYKHLFKVGICFPSYYVKLFTFIVPLGIILLLNLILVCLLVYLNVSHIKNIQESKISLKELSIPLSCILYTVGFPWIFGILHGFTNDNICSFIFVSTVSFQGFILFVYTVIFKKLYGKPANKCYWKQIKNSSKKSCNNSKTELLNCLNESYDKDFQSVNIEEMYEVCVSLGSKLENFLKEIK